MANSYIEYNSGLTGTTFSVPFKYISVDDVHALGYDGTTYVPLTVASRSHSAKTITLAAAPSAYTKVRVYRATATTQLVDFQNGSRLSEADLDTAYQQGLFVAQEVSEDANTNQYVNFTDAALLASTSLSEFSSSTHTGDDSEVAFDLSFVPKTSLPQAFLVAIDGVLQSPVDAYTISITPAQITFASAPPLDAEIVVTTTAAATGAIIENLDVKATGSTEPRSLSDRFADTFHVNDFGVIGQGNDTAIINAALAHIDSVGGGILLHDNATYEITDKIKVGKNTTLRGKTNTTYKRVAYTTMLTNELNTTVSTSGYTGNGNLTIENITFDGNAKYYYKSFNHTAIGYAENVIVRNCTFLDGLKAHAIDLSSCKNVLIEDNKFLGFSIQTTSPDGYDGGSEAWPASGDRTYAEAVQLDANTTSGFGFGAIDRTPSLNITFKGNIVGKNPAHNDNTFTSYGVGIGGHSGRHDVFMENIKIVDNTFNDCLYSGVRPFKWKNTHIAGNTFNGCNRDIHFTNPLVGSDSSKDVSNVQTNLAQSGENVVIEGNVFKGTIEQSVFFPENGNVVLGSDLFSFTKNVIIANNTFSAPSPSDESIDLSMVSNAQITGNVFDTTPRCIHLSYVNNIIVSGNVANDVTTEFLWTIDYYNAAAVEGDSDYYLNNIANRGHTNNITVVGNSINKCGRSAINFDGAHKQISVIGNSIIDADQEVGGNRAAIVFQGEMVDGVDVGPQGITVTGNSSVKSPTGTTPYRGVWITSPCSDAFLGLNHFVASDNPEINSASGDSYRVFDRNNVGGRQLLAFTAQNSSEDGGQLNLYGKDDSAYPNSVLIDLGQSGTSGNFIITDCPTSPTGLPSGAVYSAGGTLKIV